MKLSPRLQAIIEMVPPVSCIADIGSDHAYVPISLVQQHRIQRAIASEITIGPLTISQNDIQMANLQNQIVTRLADGLTGLKAADQVDLAVIAGMGGQLITQILERGRRQLNFIPQLILEPNNDEACVRRWLSMHRWQIITEQIIQEDQHIYEIIHAQKSEQEQPLTQQQIMFGPQLMLQQNSAFKYKWQRQLQLIHFMYENLQQAQHPQPKKLALAQQRIHQIEEVLQ